MQPTDIEKQLAKGTTTVAVKCKDCAILVADMRASMGTLVASDHAKKVHQLNDFSAITIAGLVSDAQYIIDIMQAQIRAVQFGENITVVEPVNLYGCSIGDSCFVGPFVEIQSGVTIGRNCRIESSVNMTGSDDYPLRIGDNVTIKGTSYVFGSIIEKNCWIEHSVIIHMHVDCVKTKDGTIRKIKYYLPPEFR